MSSFFSESAKVQRDLECKDRELKEALEAYHRKQEELAGCLSYCEE